MTEIKGKLHLEEGAVLQAIKSGRGNDAPMESQVVVLIVSRNALPWTHEHYSLYRKSQYALLIPYRRATNTVDSSQDLLELYTITKQGVGPAFSNNQQAILLIVVTLNDLADVGVIVSAKLHDGCLAGGEKGKGSDVSFDLRQFATRLQHVGYHAFYHYQQQTGTSRSMITINNLAESFYSKPRHIVLYVDVVRPSMYLQLNKTPSLRAAMPAMWQYLQHMIGLKKAKRKRKRKIAALSPPNGSASPKLDQPPASIDPVLGINATTDFETQDTERGHSSCRTAGQVEYVDRRPPGAMQDNLHNAEIASLRSSKSHQAVSTYGTRRPANNDRRPSDRYALQSADVKAIEHLQEKREQVINLRLKAKERRIELRGNREAIINVDSQIVQLINRLQPSQSIGDNAELVDLLQTTRTKRDELNVLAAEYNKLEDKLNRWEWELKEDEAAVYETQHTTDVEADQANDAESSVVRRSLSHQRSNSSASSEHEVQNYQSFLAEQRESRIGDAWLIEEQLEEMQLERAQLLERQRQRNIVRESIDAESRNFLDTFDSRFASLHDDLSRIYEDVASLQEKIDCHNDQVYTYDQFNDVKNQKLTPIEQKAADTELLDDFVFVTPPMVLKPEDEKLPLIPLDEIDESEISPSMRRVNRWLLTVLRGARWPWFTLRNVILGPEYDQMLDEDIASEILNRWETDGTQRARKDTSNSTTTAANELQHENTTTAPAQATGSDAALPTPPASEGGHVASVGVPSTHRPNPLSPWQ